MGHFEEIYTGKAAEYHRMIRREDVDGNLPAQLRQIVSFHGKMVVDLGTGTGRIPLAVGDEAGRLIGVDLNYPMLAEARRVRTVSGGSWQLLNADNRRLPLRNAVADVTTAAWTIGHLCGWYPDDWPEQVHQVLQEMLRVTRPAGVLIIVETMTTGGEGPAPPTEALARYYRFLEAAWGFKGSVIRTDYQFNSPADAVEKTAFFFGETLAERIRQKGWARLPEWTGVWHREV